MGLLSPEELEKMEEGLPKGSHQMMKTRMEQYRATNWKNKKDADNVLRIEQIRRDLKQSEKDDTGCGVLGV